MIISELVFIGILEIFLVLFAGLIYVIYNNRRLRTQLAAKSASLQEVTKIAKKNQHLYDQLKLRGYSDKLEIERSQSQNKYSLDETISITTLAFTNCEPEKLPAVIRHWFFATELMVNQLPLQQEKWQTIESRYQPLVEVILNQQSSEESSEERKDSESTDIFNMNRWADFTEAARQVLSEDTDHSKQKLSEMITSVSADLGFDEAPDTELMTTKSRAS